jgi:hypothetical protein
MFKIIGADGKEYGPVSAEVVREWIAAHRANAQTRAQAEGSSDWKPLGEFPEFAAALAAQAALPPPRSESTVAADAITAAALARDRMLSVGDCLARSWGLLKDNLFLFAAATSLILVGEFIAVAIAKFIPVAGVFVAWALVGVLEAGLYWLILKRVRGQRADLGDAFAGFSAAFPNLAMAAMLTKLLTTIGGLFCLLPGIYLLVAWKWTFPVILDKRAGFWPGMEISRRVITQHWWSLFALVLVTGVIKSIVPLLFGLVAVLFAGALLAPLAASLADQSGLPAAWVPLLILILVFVMGYALGWLLSAPFLRPFAIGALVYAYEDLFGERPAPSAT